MNKIFTKAALAVACLAVVAGQASAQMVGGVNYKIVSKTDKTAEVTFLEGDDSGFEDDPVYTGKVEIPASVKIGGTTYTVVGVGKMAFSDASLTSLTLPSTIKYLGYGSFWSATLPEKFTMPASVDSIGENAFWGTNVTSLDLSNVRKIGTYAFIECKSLEKVVLGSKLDTIPANCFESCIKLKDINLPSTLKGIGKFAFNECYALDSIIVPEGVTTLAGYCFGKCEGIKKAVIPESVTSLGDGVLGACTSLTSVKLPSHLTTLPEFTFGYCAALKDYEVGDKVTKLGKQAFTYCLGLESVTLPASLTEIGTDAFVKTPALRTVTVKAQVPPTGAVFGDSTYTLGTLYVPAGCVKAYKEAEGWSKFANIKEITSTGVNTALAAAVKVVAVAGGVSVEAAADAKVAVYAVSGRQEYAGKPGFIALGSGVHVVVVGAKAFKVAVE